MPLITGIRSAPTTEMYTRCCTLACAAARTRFRAFPRPPCCCPQGAEQSQLPPPRHGFASPVAGLTSHESNTLAGLAGTSAEHSYFAALVAQEWDYEAAECTYTASQLGFSRFTSSLERKTSKRPCTVDKKHTGRCDTHLACFLSSLPIVSN